jgi:hypothetical protein
MPLTLPRHVSPEYGMLIESTPMTAVPETFSAHDVRPGALATASALHVIWLDGVTIVPCAVPVNFRSPGQEALNDPFAAVADCSLTVHLKSVHVLGVGMSCADVQLPIRELMPATVGSVRELLCSKPVHAAALAATDNTMTRTRFFILVSGYAIGQSRPAE